MQRKFIFLINPISGTASKQKLPELIASAAEKYQQYFEILPTVASGDYHFVKQKIREEKFTDVIICGGDGSVNTVVQDVRETGVNFGIVPLGSGNGLALTANISTKPQKALEIVFTGKPSYVDGFLINQSFACMLCGLGFDAKVAHDFAKQKKRGLFTYAQQSLKNFISAKPYSFDIDLDETSFSSEAYFISIANSNQFGNQFTIAPKARLNDGLLDIVVVRKMSKAQLPLSLLDQIAGRNDVENPHSLKKSGIIYLQADKLVIKNKDAAPLHIDGEPKETSKQFSIRVIPNCFKLIQP
ncbi:MAG: YegS/Rv2252/BmrU family lipid kinase [Chitinophagaceae bacterium]